MSSYSQKNDVYPKMKLEIGAGYEYANLNSFNEAHIIPVGYGRFLDDLHSGWSVNLRAPLQFSSAIELSLLMNYRHFRMKDRTDLESTVAAPFTTQLNIAEVYAFEGGLQSTVYLDQLWGSEDTRAFNIGVFGSGAFVFAKLRTIVLRDGDYKWGTFTLDRIPHWNATFGMALRYRLHDSYFNSIVLNSGLTYSTAGKEHDVDLNGFFTRVFIGLGR